ncbi:MAG: hypothetical protein GX053_03590 [Tissierella sp.]|nr:hypothetical protein [Tissierella sp.]
MEFVFVLTKYNDVSFKLQVSKALEKIKLQYSYLTNMKKFLRIKLQLPLVIIRSN